MLRRSKCAAGCPSSRCPVSAQLWYGPGDVEDERVVAEGSAAGLQWRSNGYLVFKFVFVFVLSLTHRSYLAMHFGDQRWNTRYSSGPLIAARLCWQISHPLSGFCN